ncbi:hypothetical protein Val02_49600 [Virgisporangium aliadipatigenens]|uniref:DUF4389 domain-containing protein n=1 Tax=Virgisporangium aliadipatigenens TaxID=741659 RepID=A0A8J3YM73_9ACTN|nr:DUF4389 domain-containing protein [Virgisporangium aliadipatigenens]GIJ48074.1 hypothetical protein Val02_49600 [Virgisporangium aliadipatigenens]
MGTYPVRVSAQPDRPGRWLWLVKWLLLIPHYIVLAVLWTAFVAMTLIAYVAVLFTGRYPGGIFDFNVGVLRWTWRVWYYGYSVLGTDRYPPFTLADVADYPARLSVDGPPRPPRWLPLVAWLLALPHLVIVGIITSGGFSNGDDNGWRLTYAGGVLGVLVLIAALFLLFAGRYPGGLYDLVIGLNRWVLRTIAYVTLLTDRYPPFRLDQGAVEPGPTDPPPVPPEKKRDPGGRLVVHVTAIVLGALMLAGGALAATGGAAALAMHASRDANGYVEAPAWQVATSTAAVTAGRIEVGPGDVFGQEMSGVDAVRITVANHGDAALFLGVAPAGAVERWLDGIAHDELSAVYGPDDSRTVHRTAGTVGPVVAPTTAGFWYASVTGTDTLRLDWTPVAGTWTVVLARADGMTGLSAEVGPAVRLSFLQPLGTALLAGGVVAILVALLLIYLGGTGLAGGARRDRPPSAPEGPPTAEPPPPAADSRSGEKVGAGSG